MGFDLSSVDSDVWAAACENDVTDVPISDRTTYKWDKARQALQTQPVATDRLKQLAMAEEGRYGERSL